jgi:hypothetical protein
VTWTCNIIFFLRKHLSSVKDNIFFNYLTLPSSPSYWQQPAHNHARAITTKKVCHKAAQKTKFLPSSLLIQSRCIKKLLAPGSNLFSHAAVGSKTFSLSFYSVFSFVFISVNSLRIMNRRIKDMEVEGGECLPESSHGIRKLLKLYKNFNAFQLQNCSLLLSHIFALPTF